MIKINLLARKYGFSQFSLSYKVLTLFSIVMIIAITGSFVFAQSSKSQLVCREKAKEAAKTMYTNCMAEVKDAELEKVRDDYKNKMDQLKNYYDKKIKTISPSDEELPSKSKHQKRKNQKQRSPLFEQKITPDETPVVEQKSVKNLAPNHSTTNPIIPYKDPENVQEKSQERIQEELHSVAPNEETRPAFTQSTTQPTEVVPEPEISNPIDEDFR